MSLKTYIKWIRMRHGERTLLNGTCSDPLANVTYAHVTYAHVTYAHVEPLRMLLADTLIP